MEIPDDVLAIIREYSKPLTRPDWRFIHKMTHLQFLRDYYREYKKREYKLQKFYNIYSDITYKNIFNAHNYCRVIYCT